MADFPDITKLREGYVGKVSIKKPTALRMVNFDVGGVEKLYKAVPVPAGFEILDVSDSGSYGLPGSSIIVKYKVGKGYGMPSVPISPPGGTMATIASSATQKQQQLNFIDWYNKIQAAQNNRSTLSSYLKQMATEVATKRLTSEDANKLISMMGSYIKVIDATAAAQQKYLDFEKQIMAATSVDGVNSVLKQIQASSVLSGDQKSRLGSLCASRINNLKIPTAVTPPVKPPTVAAPPVSSPGVVQGFKDQLAKVASLSELESLKSRITSSYNSKYLTQADYNTLIQLVGVRGVFIQSAQAKEVYSKFLSQINAAGTPSTLNYIRDQVIASFNAKNLSQTQYQQLLQSIATKTEALRATSSKALVSQLVSQIQTARAIPTVESLRDQVNRAFNRGEIDSGQAMMLMETINTRAKLLQAAEAPKVPEVPTVPEVPKIPEVAKVFELPTIAEILASTSISELEKYERQVEDAFTQGGIGKATYTSLTNAINLRVDQLKKEEAAKAKVPEEEVTAPAAAPMFYEAPAEAAQPIVVTPVISAPAPAAAPPTIVTMPAAPAAAPTIIAMPAAPVAAPAEAVPREAAPAVSPFDLMGPNEGPPLPRSWGIRWPWTKA